MGLWDRLRRRRLPAAARPALEEDERVVGFGATADEQWVVATDRGVWLPAGDRLGWHEVNKATWTGAVLTLVPVVPQRELVELALTVVADGPPVRYRLSEPGLLPHEVRTRVTRSVLFTAHHPLPGGGVRIVARKVLGAGHRWAARYDPGTPEIDTALEQLVQEDRDASGLA